MPAHSPRAVGRTGRAMKLSVPKPMHGWREFAGEVGIIVIGVLIALGAQQLAEGWQWRQRTDDARVALAREITNISALHYERLIVQRCLLGRLDFLADRLEKSGPEWKAEPEYFINPRRFMSNALPIAYRPPQRDLVDSIWVSVRSDQTLGHLKSNESADIAAIYANARSVDALQIQEQEMAVALGPLARDLKLDPGDRTRMLQLIYALDGLNASLVFKAKDLITDIGKLDLPFDPAAIRTTRQELLDRQVGYRGVCVETLPLDIGFVGPVMGERPSATR